MGRKSFASPSPKKPFAGGKSSGTEKKTPHPLESPSPGTKRMRIEAAIPDPDTFDDVTVPTIPPFSPEKPPQGEEHLSSRDAMKKKGEKERADAAAADAAKKKTAKEKEEAAKKKAAKEKEEAAKKKAEKEKEEAAKRKAEKEKQDAATADAEKEREAAGQKNNKQESPTKEQRTSPRFNRQQPEIIHEGEPDDNSAAINGGNDLDVCDDSPAALSQHEDIAKTPSKKTSLNVSVRRLTNEEFNTHSPSSRKEQNQQMASSSTPVEGGQPTPGLIPRTSEGGAGSIYNISEISAFSGPQNQEQQQHDNNAHPMAFGPFPAGCEG